METLSGGAIPYARVDCRGERRHALACLRTAARKKTCWLEAKVVEDISTQRVQHLVRLCNRRGKLGFPSWYLPLAQPQTQCMVAGSCDGCSKHTYGKARRAQMIDTIVWAAYSVFEGTTKDKLSTLVPCRINR